MIKTEAGIVGGPVSPQRRHRIKEKKRQSEDATARLVQSNLRNIRLFEEDWTMR
ncbi:hypothetical protein XPA_008804 [Xanthoria parietina]